ncbi:hypothetical protein J2T22_001624 [Pseudarthrobacter defluvii]|uniref:Uncharacterized protein n=1 Tax=Pseudarthrobacter defluvii TaxID=410837 RepID=A0ABT9UFN4_9MICC|nr:hypothetical protein [Pseudarthrobacter defluvii]
MTMPTSQAHTSVKGQDGDLLFLTGAVPAGVGR